MNTSLAHRFVAAVASVVVTFSLLSAIVAEAQPPIAHSVLAQAAAPVVR